MQQQICKTVWVVRAGKNSRAHELFLHQRVIALQDPGMGDLKAIKAERESFYSAYRRCDPKNTRTGIAGIGGKFFRFAHEIAVGDIVLCPSPMDGRVYFGYVTGCYRFAPSVDKTFPHRRSVRWCSTFRKSDLSELAQRELGAARTLFEMKNHAEEVLTRVKVSHVKTLS